MNTTVKKLIVILTVMIVSLYYFRVLYHEGYSGASFKKVAGLVLSILLLYGWVGFVTTMRKQDNFFTGNSSGNFFLFTLLLFFNSQDISFFLKKFHLMIGGKNE